MTKELETPEQRNIRSWFLLKFMLMYILMISDLLFNSTNEFTTSASTYIGGETALNNTKPALGQNTPNEAEITLTIATVMCQVFLQILGFLNLFLLLGSTFLFQNGLLGILVAKFKLVLCCHPIYGFITISLGAARAMLLSQGTRIIYLLDVEWYFILSVVQKFASVIYYVSTVNTLIRLGKPKFYSKEVWVKSLKI